jgi:hypothetical protein
MNSYKIRWSISAHSIHWYGWSLKPYWCQIITGKTHTIAVFLIIIFVEINGHCDDWLALQLRIQNVPGSVFGPETGYSARRVSCLSSFYSGGCRESTLTYVTAVSFPILCNSLFTNKHIRNMWKLCHKVVVNLCMKYFHNKCHVFFCNAALVTSIKLKLNTPILTV